MKSGKPVYITRGAEPRYGCCYSGDVVSAVLAVLAAGSKTFGEAYQFQQAERPSAVEVLEAMAATGVYPEPQAGAASRVRVLTPEQLAQLLGRETRHIFYLPC